MKWAIHKQGVAVACGAVLASAAIAACGGSSATTGSGGGTSHTSHSPSSNNSVLTVESSQVNSITQDFNPFVSSSAATAMGAVSMVYEPLLQANLTVPGKYYPWLATGYKWSNAGRTITFTIRKGVKWSNGTTMTPADVAFTYDLMKKYPDVNTQGLTLTSVKTSGDTVTLNFPTPQYANLEDIAGQVYIVPQAIWSKVGDPGKYTDPNPVGTGPYTVKTFTSQGITLASRADYWGGKPSVGTVEFPTYASASSALSALETGQLAWAGNFITGVNKVYLAGHPDHKTWFVPSNTVTLEPNLHEWPTDQLPVRKAISLAIDRAQVGTQGEDGLEPPATNASGLTLPEFQKFLSPSVSSDTLSTSGNAAAAENVLKQAGYTRNSSGYFEKGGRVVTVSITDPTAYSDYSRDDQIIAANLRSAGIDATAVGQSVGAWSADVASGNFQLTEHWSVTSVSPYQLYNNWLNGALATSNRAGNFEGLKDPAIDADLQKLASDSSTSAQITDLGPIEQYVAKNLPIIPVVYGVTFDEHNTDSFTGWPSASDSYQSGTPGAPSNEVVVLHLKPTS